MLVLTIGVAFLGYVLPWGQMSLWGATVITGLLRVINQRVVYWLWGHLWVSLPTITFFYSLHFVLPFIILALIIVHITTLHSPLSSFSKRWKGFHPSYRVKDIINLRWYGLLFILVRWSLPFLFEPVNFDESNIRVSPIHILPEWYFLWAYAILRCIPNKLLGVVALLLRLIVILFIRSKSYKGSIFILLLINLVEIGGFPVEDPFVVTSQVLTFFYFIIRLIFPYGNYFDRVVLRREEQ